MAQKTLTTVPFTIDAEAIAIGILEEFDENERAALRFGMLPAKKMEVVRKALENRFRSISTHATGTADACTAICKEPNPRCIDFSMKKLVAEAEREICLGLYKHGDLVV